MHANEAYIIQALKAGAKGYLLKDSADTELLRGVTVVASGKSFFSPAVAKELGPSMPISSLRAWRARALSPRVAIPFTRRIPKRASDPSLPRIMMALVRCIHAASLFILPIKIHALHLR